MSSVSAPTLRLTDPVQYVKGIGPRRAEVLKEVGVQTVEDLLYYIPRRYLDRRVIKAIRDLRVGEETTVVGQVVASGMKRTRRRHYFQMTIDDGTGFLTCIWFNGIEWVRNRFNKGDRLALHGRVEFYRQPQLIHPDFDHLDSDDDPLHTSKIIAIYPESAHLRSKGLDSRSFRRIFSGLWDRLEPVPDHFNAPFRKQYSLPILLSVLKQIHSPDNDDSLQTARYRLKFDEYFFLQLLMALRRRAVQETPGREYPELGEYVKRIYKNIPFELTDAQIRVMREIRHDFSSGRVMNRLLQGDVGSGKTVIALLSAAIVAGHSGQVALMAPTEILAEQHYRNFRSLCAKVELPLALFTGSTPQEERKSILGRLQDGGLPIVIGTHTLFQEGVAFRDLALIIVDEQHRFGVLQRGKLIEKGFNPHVLTMTATPIPRTLAITYHGDMDVSVLDELPKNRADIHTRIVTAAQLDEVYTFMRSEMAKGHQCFVVYPLIDEPESGTEPVTSAPQKAVTAGYKLLKEKVFPEFNVGLLHGRMKSPEKEAEMSDFINGTTALLVATTVIEVGIDVANATIMLIEDAERFGLSQLHQLRGRIGRGGSTGHCILVQRDTEGEAAQRLAILERTSDGFEISDEDLKLRGPGQFFGSRQHGFESSRIADLAADGPIIRTARQAAFALIDSDPQLAQSEHRLLKGLLVQKYHEQLDYVRIK